jgi:hypothetical protein
MIVAPAKGRHRDSVRDGSLNVAIAPSWQSAAWSPKRQPSVHRSPVAMNGLPALEGDTCGHPGRSRATAGR